MLYKNNMRYTGTEFGEGLEDSQLKEFLSAAALEEHLESQDMVLSDERCPSCGTRLLDMGAHSPVPASLKGLLGCANQTCPDHKSIYRLPTSSGLKAISAVDYNSLLRNRQVNR